jgi:hypothetical protein
MEPPAGGGFAQQPQQMWLPVAQPQQPVSVGGFALQQPQQLMMPQHQPPQPMLQARTPMQAALRKWALVSAPTAEGERSRHAQEALLDDMFSSATGRALSVLLSAEIN